MLLRAVPTPRSSRRFGSSALSDAPPGFLVACSVWHRCQARNAHESGLAYSGLGERNHAERLYEKMLDADPKNMDALCGLAALSIQANDFDTALEFHVRLIDLGECSAEVLYNTGLV